jgi:hypothetical protein
MSLASEEGPLVATRQGPPQRSSAVVCRVVAVALWPIRRIGVSVVAGEGGLLALPVAVAFDDEFEHG